MILTKEQILARRLKREVIDVGDDQQIVVTALPLHIMEQSHRITSKDYGADAFLFVHAVIDEAGNRLYSDEEIPLVAKTIESATVNLVVTTVLRLDAIDGATLEKIKKNLNSLDLSPSGVSPSASDTPTPT